MSCIQDYQHLMLEMVPICFEKTQQVILFNALIDTNLFNFSHIKAQYHLKDRSRNLVTIFNLENRSFIKSVIHGQY